ncbi:type II toxin-antitoxin system PemK/MazF family toxin [Helicobacter suis]|uniref:type II toxin-antitoxin system PemK/MazF family toxin n=1 Tax=Helicobacter suis TaxID=104628 RepID=UPI001F07B2C2|nr:type II toxin-antitoxin system PemK/MazF family toxin [Helicobacter suis]
MLGFMYAQNIYRKGHEQGKKRPYFVIYEDKVFVLAFPVTTQDKQSREYPSHENYIVSGGEVMVDQLQIIPRLQIQSFKENQKTELASQLRDIKILMDRKRLVEHFLKQIILQNKSCEIELAQKLSFGDVITLNNENPLLCRYPTFIVLSSDKFHLSSMCLVAPYENESIIFKLLHCIDFQARDFSIKHNIKEWLAPADLYDKVKKSLFSH